MILPTLPRLLWPILALAAAPGAASTAELTLERALELPEVRAARSRAQASGQALHRTRAARRPRLDAAASYGWLENETFELDDFANWSASLVLTVPIDLRGRLSAEIARRQTEVGVTSLLDLIDADTTLADAEVARATARVDLLAAVAALELVWPEADPPDGGVIP